MVFGTVEIWPTIVARVEQILNMRSNLKMVISLLFRKDAVKIDKISESLKSLGKYSPWFNKN